MHPYYKSTSHCPICSKQLVPARSKVDYDVSANNKYCYSDQYYLFNHPVDSYWERRLIHNSYVFYNEESNNTEIMLRERDHQDNGIFHIAGKHIFSENLEEIINNYRILL